ncbi:MBL fold metallo-hydrolase [Alicyclobacillus acidiphilus]|uniref:MBL fold metallo-hydrolase n=1 Tax=Alicyclobacillus acidiphilus TaxID=182455 RepID=UPI00082E45C4|nr:MBL fold metallo-hydrolase [Alicyclobacillus acidiphilus]
MVRLAEGFYMISSGNLTHPWDANAYLFPGQEPALVDCGSPLGYAALKESLRQFGYEPKDIRKVIGTHGHWDHVSGMASLRQESDAVLWLHPADKEQVEHGDYDKTAAFLYGEPFPATPVDHLLEDGQDILAGDHTLKVIHTPGHSIGSICLWFEVGGIKILISADTVGGGFHPRVGSDLVQWEHSLDKLMKLDFDVYTMGHSNPTLIYDAKRKIQEAREQFNVYLNPWFRPFHVSFTY